MRASTMLRMGDPFAESITGIGLMRPRLQSLIHYAEKDDAKLNYGLFPYRPDRGCNAADARLRRVFENARPLGSPADVHDLRPRGLLRFFEEQTRDETFPFEPASHHEVDRAGRPMGLVLPG